MKTRGISSGPAAPELARVFTDEADHEVVQHRLALLYGVLGAFSLGLFLAGSVVVALALPERFWGLHMTRPRLISLVFCLGFVGVWLVFRGPLRPRWLVSLVDLVGSAKVIVAAAVHIAFAPPELHNELAIFIPLLLVVFLRAALVPSPPRWTALVAAVSAAPAPFAAYISAVNDPGWDDVLAPPRLVAVAAALWSVVVVIAAWTISKVVYGLRAEVKKAMRLGQYTLEDKLGEGGMGVVYRARHALLRRPTAVKLLSPERANAQDIRRFEREVQLTSMLTHPNTVAVYDFGHTEGGIFYYAMELLDGISLHALVERDGPQPSGRVIHILTQLASALAEAHAIGLVHRDVKPANVFLCERGGIPDFVKVLDFGLVKHAGRTDPNLSRRDAIAGTPHYMAPESITDPDSVDARVDIYALGAVGYFLLTGTTVFDGTNLVEVCSHHLHTAPEPPRTRLGPDAKVSRALEDLLLRCLAKARDERPRSATDVLDALRACDPECEWDARAAREWWRRERSLEAVVASQSA